MNQKRQTRDGVCCLQLHTVGLVTGSIVVQLFSVLDYAPRPHSRTTKRTVVLAQKNGQKQKTSVWPSRQRKAQLTVCLVHGG